MWLVWRACALYTLHACCNRQAQMIKKGERVGTLSQRERHRRIKCEDQRVDAHSAAAI